MYLIDISSHIRLCGIINIYINILPSDAHDSGRSFGAVAHPTGGGAVPILRVGRPGRYVLQVTIGCGACSVGWGGPEIIIFKIS